MNNPALYNSLEELVEHERKYARSFGRFKSLALYYVRCVCTVRPRSWMYNIRHIKWWFQRMFYGVSDRDVWGLDNYLSRVIARGTKKLLANACGHPTTVKDLDEWKAILADIQWAYNVNVLMADAIVYAPSTPEEREFEMCSALDLFEKYGFRTYILTPEEVARYERGQKLFAQHFYSLWD